MTIDKIHNFNIDENSEIVKDSAYLGSGINSNRDCNQEIKKVWDLEGKQWKN